MALSTYGKACVKDHFPNLVEFEDLLHVAELQADRPKTMDFVESLKEKYEQYGKNMFLSQAQLDFLERIAD
jgi:hypothetical protein